MLLLRESFREGAEASSYIVFFPIKTLEAIKRQQLEKYHKADEKERENIELNPYTIFHQALKNCEPIIGLVSILRGGRSYQVNHQTIPELRQLCNYLLPSSAQLGCSWGGGTFYLLSLNCIKETKAVHSSIGINSRCWHSSMGGRTGPTPAPFLNIKIAAAGVFLGTVYMHQLW